MTSRVNNPHILNTHMPTGYLEQLSHDYSLRYQPEDTIFEGRYVIQFSLYLVGTGGYSR